MLIIQMQSYTFPQESRLLCMAAYNLGLSGFYTLAFKFKKELRKIKGACVDQFNAIHFYFLTGDSFFSPNCCQ